MEFSSLGLTLAHITAELREKYSLADDSTGVVVTEVNEGIDGKADLLPGDLIVGFGSNRITDLSEFRLLLDIQRQTDTKSIVLFRQRGEKSEFVTVEIKSTPVGAKVSVDGRRVGYTPVALKIPEGETRKVIVSKKGYIPKPKALTAESSSPIFFRLTKKDDFEFMRD